MTRPLPVAPDWLQVTRADDWLRCITEPHVHSFLRASIWHLRGDDRDLVADSGLGVAPLREHLPWLFERDPILVRRMPTSITWVGAHEFPECYAHPLENARSPGPASLTGPPWSTSCVSRCPSTSTSCGAR